jgi:Uma2 family endonuclease
MSLDAVSLHAPIPGPLRRFSVDEYHRLRDSGFFDDDERYELLEGWIATKMTRKPPHDAVIDLLADLLRAMLPPGLRVRVKSAITTCDSEPEPDLAVVRGHPRDYLDHHPGPGEIALLVEVADSSVDRDRAKARIYARAGIATYWIVNLPERLVEVYTAPSGDTAAPRYHRREDFAPGVEVPLVVDGRAIGALAATEILPG